MREEKGLRVGMLEIPSRLESLGLWDLGWRGVVGVGFGFEGNVFDGDWGQRMRGYGALRCRILLYY